MIIWQHTSIPNLVEGLLTLNTGEVRTILRETTDFSPKQFGSSPRDTYVLVGYDGSRQIFDTLDLLLKEVQK